MVATRYDTPRDIKSPSCGFRDRINVAAIVVGLVFATTAHATDRFFPDLTVTSPNKRFQLKASSPDNASGRRRPAFQSHFNYRLTDQQQGRELWSRDQPMRDKKKNIAAEGPPSAAYVSDDGWTVIRTADARAAIELIVISPAGEEKIRVDLFSALFPDLGESFDYTAMSTAGTVWGPSYCHFYFTSIQGSPHFCLRAWWDKRVLLNLDEGRRIELDEEIRSELFETEKKFVLDALKRTGDWTWITGKYGRPVLSKDSLGLTLREGIKAIHMAGRMKLREAVPPLQALQSCSYIGPTTGSRGPYEASTGGIKPYSYQSLRVRQLSQLSLRRIGVRPSGHQATTLYRVGNGYWRPDDPLTYRRESKVSEITVGLKPEQVLNEIGAPDFIVSKAWEYDMDSDTPYTLIISWGPKGVEKVTRRTPAKWSDGTIRDRKCIVF